MITFEELLDNEFLLNQTLTYRQVLDELGIQITNNDIDISSIVNYISNIKNIVSTN